MIENISKIISQLTLEEKASLCSGLNNWQSKPIERLNIPSIYMTDGPHGLRREGDDGFGNSEPATCFPTASCLASTWNVGLIEEVGKAIGEECQAQGVQIILGPGANIKRSPLNGRNFEYYSEDPIVSGDMAAALINGIQSEGVAACLKHYAVNNQETERMSINVKVDERAMREIYLAGFERAVKKSQPMTMMCAYNKINGVFASEDKSLLHDILKTEWNFEGIVMSDWGAVHDRVEALKAGLHFEMPGNGGINDKKIVEAVQNGQLEEERLDEIVREWLQVIMKTHEAKGKIDAFEKYDHHSLARKAAAEGIVLLKNDAGILPIEYKYKKVAIIGRFAMMPRVQGLGSSNVNPTMKDDVYGALLRLTPSFAERDFLYADGYDEDHETNNLLLLNAQSVAQNAEVALVFIGLPDSFETEGADRKHLGIPESHQALIEKVTDVQPNTVVILYNGSPVEMPWANKVPAIVEGWLGGQGSGRAMASILLGKTNPSGKLTETFPKKLEDNPSFLHFPGTLKDVKYGESIFVGYRYYEKKGIKPLFPFGHGLSYTKFTYSDIKLSANEMTDEDTLKVSLKVKNSGKSKGKEVVQLYVKAKNSTIIRPIKELKGFEKVKLKPKAEKKVSFELSKRDFAFYDEETKSWKVDKGAYEILVGSSSADIRLKAVVEIQTVQNKLPKLTKYASLKEYLKHPKGNDLLKPLYDKMLNHMSRSVPDDQPAKQKEVRQFFVHILNDLPLYKLETFSEGRISREQLQEIVVSVNS